MEVEKILSLIPHSNTLVNNKSKVYKCMDLSKIRRYKLLTFSNMFIKNLLKECYANILLLNKNKLFVTWNQKCLSYKYIFGDVCIPGLLALDLFDEAKEIWKKHSMEVPFITVQKMLLKKGYSLIVIDDDKSFTFKIEVYNDFLEVRKKQEEERQKQEEERQKQEEEQKKRELCYKEFKEHTEVYMSGLKKLMKIHELDLDQSENNMIKKHKSS